VSAHRLVVGTRFKWIGVTYEVRRVLPDAKLNIEDLHTGAVSIVEVLTLVEALFHGELEIEVRPAEAGPRVVSLALDDYPANLVQIARSRLEVIAPLLDVAGRIREMVEARAVEIGVDAVTLYRWIEAYEESGRDLRVLIPAYQERGGKGESRLMAGLDAIVDGVIQEKYLVREKVTIKDVRDEIAVRLKDENKVRPEDKQLPKPSRSTIYRRIEALGMAERFRARHGKKAAQRELSQYGQSDRPTHLFERLEFDNTRTDLIVLDDQDDLPLGRLNLTTSLCTASGYPGGYYLGFEPPSVYSLMECVFHTICPKEDVQAKYGTEHPWLACGVPSAVAVDNGKEFLSQAFEDACSVLGIDLMRMPVATPYYKASVERFFKTLDTGLFHVLPGTTFSNPTARGDYKSMAQACIYLSQVDCILHLFLLDVYAEDFHKGLNGIPARLWASAASATFSPRLPRSVEELRILLGRFEMRVVHHYGVELENLLYNHPDLAPLRARLKGEPVKVRFHPGDLSQVDVFDPFEKRYIKVPALAQEYTRGLSLWKHKVILNYIHSIGEAVNIESLGRAKRKIQEIVDAGRSRRKASNRARQARWETSGRPSREVGVPQIPAPSKPSAQPDVQSLEAGLLGLSRGADWSVEEVADDVE